MQEFFEATFLTPLRQLYQHLVQFFPRLAGAAVLVMLGLFLAWLTSKLIRKSLVAFHFDRFSDHVGLNNLLEKAKISKAPSELLSLAVYWFVFLNFFMIAVRTLDEPVMSGVFSKFFSYLPNLLVAVLIILLGLIAGKFISRSVLVAATNAGLRSARILSTGVDLLMIMFTLSLALEQMGIGQSTIVAAFSILFGGVVLALALAFGLGGRHLARQFLEKTLVKKPETPKDHEP
jgi:uncharacterized protein YneF (UPF0154 family)